MNSLEKQKWIRLFNLSDKDFKNWEGKEEKDSFIFWSLEKKIIKTQDYFDWAMEHYQIPQLQDVFLEYYIMKSSQWMKVKDIHNWTKQQMPLAVWNDIVFIGCLEPSTLDRDFDFEYRFVLASPFVLKTMWNFTRSLSNNILANENKSFQKKSGQKLNDLNKRSQVHLSEAKAYTKNQDLKSSVPLQAQFPETEERRTHEDLERNTFPGRDYGHGQTHSINMKNIHEKNIEKTSPEKLFVKDVEDLEHDRNSTSTAIVILNNKKYNELWSQTKKIFFTSLVLEVKDSQVYLLDWSGNIKVADQNEKLIHLNEHSLFKVINRGHSYHGFVVDNAGNKSFFDKLGLNNYPKHVSAVPVQNSNNELKYIFLGFSERFLLSSSIYDLEQMVSNFFNLNKKELKLAA